jgi:hypothetical protein
MMQDRLFTLLLDQLAEMPQFLRSTVVGLPRELLVRKPKCDKSDLLEHLWHTRDRETDLYGLRIRRILNGERPHLEPVDVGAWPLARGYRDRDGNEAIAGFERERAALLDELRALSAAQLCRVGIRIDGTENSVLDVVDQLAAHDRDHRWRITAILREFATHDI